MFTGSGKTSNVQIWHFRIPAIISTQVLANHSVKQRSWQWRIFWHPECSLGKWECFAAWNFVRSNMYIHIYIYTYEYIYIYMYTTYVIYIIYNIHIVYIYICIYIYIYNMYIYIYIYLYIYILYIQYVFIYIIYIYILYIYTHVYIHNIPPLDEVQHGLDPHIFIEERKVFATHSLKRANPLDVDCDISLYIPDMQV